MSPTIIKLATDASISDGGGVRGLSSIIILGYLMDQLGAERGRQVEPWEEFDMISGTSTGG
jgi:patatin-like phospholipase/acyl hydrolase